MNVLSLFSGIGGFDLGFERAGMKIVGVCEIDKHAQKILQRHFPNAMLHTDVKEVHYDRGAIDVICGGFPCQDVSVAGKRRGLNGERSGLWFEFARIIDDVQPKWVVIENVPGLLSSNGGRDFATIIQWLANRGYGVGWRVLDSQGFGLAQRRKRVFIVGSFGTPRGCTVLLERESMQWNSQPRKKTGQNDTRNIAASVGGNSEKRVLGVQDVSPTLRANAKQSLMSGSGDINSPLAIDVWQQQAYVMREYAGNNTFSIQPTDVSLTLQATQPAPTSHHAQLFVHKTGCNSTMIGVRRITPTECERLQGFPDGWTDGQSDAQRYKQLGNAVSVNVAQWIGKRIIDE